MQNEMREHAAMKFNGRVSPFAFSFCILHSAFCIGQDWTLSTSDFRTEVVSLRGIDEKGIRVAPAGGAAATGAERVIPPEAFLQLDRSAAAAAVERPAKFLLDLVSGDRVGGEPLSLENDRLTWRNASAGELAIPMTQVAAFTRAGVPAAPDLSAPRTEDLVVLSIGDRVAGIVTGITADVVKVKTATGGDEPVAVPLKAVNMILFASSGSGPSAPATNKTSKAARTYRVRLDDGSSLLLTSLALSNNRLTASFGGSGGAALRPLELTNVVGIEQLNGPVSWLTSRRPGEDVQIPFVGATSQSAWKTRTDTDVAGHPFVVGGQAFYRGVGVHSYSRLVYPLDGSYKAFRTRYGINDSLVHADVTVRIHVGDKLVHETKHVRAGQASPVVVVDLPAAAKQLVLEVDYGDGIDVEDRLNWLEPALLREKPKPPPPAPAATQPATRPTTQPASTRPTTAPAARPAK
jgi:hypothetical protein